MPAVASRVGVDRNRLDVTDADDARWLRALVWPEHDLRHRLLRDAIAVAREHLPDVREGDALDLLPGVVAEVPADRPVCLVTTQVLYQFSERDRDRFVDLVRDLGANREFHWLASAGTSDRHDHGVSLAHFAVGDGGELREDRLLVSQQHGAWVKWLGR